GDQTFALAPDAKILLPTVKKGEPNEGKLTDLAAGTPVSLQLSVDRKTAENIVVHAPNASGEVKSADPARSTITITGAGKNQGEKTCTLAGDVKVLMPTQRKGEAPPEGKVADLTAGTLVSLTLSLDGKMVLSIVMHPPSASGSLKKADAGSNTITIAVKSKD